MGVTSPFLQASNLPGLACIGVPHVFVKFFIWKQWTLLMNFGGWVLHVNKCLRDASSSETGRETIQAGQSGSDEERKAVVFADSVDSVESASVSRAVETTEHSRAAPADRSLDPCLFYSYTAGCAKGEDCAYSHSVHADQVAVPVAKQKLTHARRRIKKRLTQHFAAQNLYEVQEQLQREARQDSFAKALIRSHLTGADSSASAASATSRH